MEHTTQKNQSSDIHWLYHQSFVQYPAFFPKMESHLELVAQGLEKESVWGLQYEPVYTAGTSAKGSDLIDAEKFPVYQSNRGGSYTYHGPGQLVVYPFVNIKYRNIDVRAYVRWVEGWIQRTLALCNIDAHPDPERIGLWVNDKKIASIGIRITKGIAWHGFSINVHPNLSHFAGIVPCGLNLGVTSLQELEKTYTLEDIWGFCKQAFQEPK